MKDAVAKIIGCSESVECERDIYGSADEERGRAEDHCGLHNNRRDREYQLY